MDFRPPESSSKKKKRKLESLPEDEAVVIEAPSEEELLAPDEGNANDLALEDFVPEVIEDDRKPKDVKADGHKIALGVKDEESAKTFMEWLIAPLSLETFYEEFWERRPLVIKRPHLREYYKGWLSKRDVEDMLERHQLLYGRNVDVTKYAGGERLTMNGDCVAEPEAVWRHYRNGCSVRLLHPQRWSDPLWLMLASLERHWNMLAGCNAYLTPAGAQGFSPHYDDIEAFILQTEGRKGWRCYRPRGPEEALPRFSSANFAQHEIGDALLEVTLDAGDLLYMPRGTIHQAVSPPETHSLHITLSTGLQNSWVDFLEIALPRALQLAAEDHVELRQGLPRDLFEFMGVVHSDRPDERREAFLERVMDCLNAVFESGPWDSAADQLAVKFLRNRLPLYSRAHRGGLEEGGASAQRNGVAAGGKGEKGEKRKGAAAGAGGPGGAEGGWGSGDGGPLQPLSKKARAAAAAAAGGGGAGAGGTLLSPGRRKIGFHSRVRLVAPGVARLVVENDAAVLYHCLQNPRALHMEGGDPDEEEEAEAEAEAGAGAGVGAGANCQESAENGGEGSEGEEEKEDEEGGGEEGEEDGKLALRGAGGGQGEGVQPEGSVGEGGVCGGGSAKEKGRIEYGMEYAEVLEQLLSSYPEGVAVSDFLLDSKKGCLRLARQLAAMGLLVLDG